MADIELDSPHPGVTRITLNRPERLNAMRTQLVQGLHEALDQIAVDPDCRVVVLTGAGRGFCAGLDLGGYGRAPHTEGFGQTQAGFGVQKHIAALIPHMRSLPQPIIAGVNGPAAGGGFALVLGSDIRIAASTARFNAAFIRIGLSASDIGVSYFLPRMVGSSVAAEYMLTGRFIDAERAYQLGLVSRIVAPAQLQAEAQGLVTDMLHATPLGLRLTKEALNHAIDAQGLEAAIAMEDRNQILASADGDFQEGVAAFLEKRPPNYAKRES
jgi:enoyl-CoA hydratase